MYQPLAPCPGCRRHVRVAEAACPFCRSSLEGLAARPERELGRLGRAALFAAAALVAGCDKSVPPTQDPATKPKPTATDTGTAPPVDDGGPDDPGAPQAEYGAPAPKADTGPDDMGTMHAKYGGAPMPHPSALPAYGLPPSKGSKFP